jgi:type II secretory pathway pseudopilin PulG
MLSLTGIKAFFSGAINIVFISIIVALCTIIGVSYLSNQSKQKEIESLNTKLGAVQTASQEFQSAASDCTAGVSAVQASEAAATQASSEAVAVAEVKASTYDKHASAVLNAKPVGTDDYKNSVALMNSLIDNRQSQLGNSK